jgi:predicted CoA-binding protein
MKLNTLVIGASTNPERYSYKAILALQKNQIPTYAIGLKEGKVGDVNIITENFFMENMHTITLYVGKANASSYYPLIVNLKPKRVIFNPGTENPELENLLTQNNIPYIEACTLVLLATNQY